MIFEEIEINDRRPYIAGLDTTTFFNMTKSWFKWDGLFNTYVSHYEIENNLKLPKETFGGVDLNHDDMTEDTKKVIEIASDVICALEQYIRDELWNHVEELEQSRIQVNSYIDGLLDAKKVPEDE